MGQFNISLPDNRKGEVRWGKVVKTASLLRLLPWVKGNVEEKTGYVIKVEPLVANETEFRLFRTKGGGWYQDEDGRIGLEGETILAIKKAIEAHEESLSR